MFIESKEYHAEINDQQHLAHHTTGYEPQQNIGNWQQTVTKPAEQASQNHYHHIEQIAKPVLGIALFYSVNALAVNHITAPGPENHLAQNRADQNAFNTHEMDQDQRSDDITDCTGNVDIPFKPEQPRTIDKISRRAMNQVEIKIRLYLTKLKTNLDWQIWVKKYQKKLKLK